MQSIQISRWTIDEFAKAEHAWTDLLAASTADPLFCGWNWLYTWWQHFGKSGNPELALLVAKDGKQDIIGIAPTYLVKGKARGIWPFTRLQLIGSAFRNPSPMFSEKSGFIVRTGLERPVIRALLNYVEADQPWDELVLSYIEAQNPGMSMVQELAGTAGHLVRESDSMLGYEIPTTGSFDAYRASLGKHTRLNAFNRRKYLETKGEVKITGYNESDPEEFFGILNQLHTQRWGQAAFAGQRLAFNLEFASRMAHTANLQCSVLTVAGRPVSALYNVRAGSREYNIQSGFDANFDKKLSLGYLHLGYAIERAFNDPEVEVFDLLGGEGKNAQFKHHLAPESYKLTTIQIVRSKPLKLAYGIYDSFSKRDIG